MQAGTMQVHSVDMAALAVSMHALEARVKACSEGNMGQDSLHEELQSLREQLAAKDVSAREVARDFSRSVPRLALRVVQDLLLPLPSTCLFFV